jgi:hypothetical protein
MAPLPRSPGDVFDDVVSGIIPHIDAKGEGYESSRHRPVTHPQAREAARSGVTA